MGVGGSYGPYTQSERRDLYHEHAKILLDQGKAYECFCTKDDSQEPLRLRNTSGPKNTFGMKARTPTEDEGAFSLYDGRCRHLTEEERARRKRAGEKYSIRFKVGRAFEIKKSCAHESDSLPVLLRHCQMTWCSARSSHSCMLVSTTLFLSSKTAGPHTTSPVWWTTITCVSRMSYVER